MSCLPAGFANGDDRNNVVKKQLEQLNAKANEAAAQLEFARAALLADPGNELLQQTVLQQTVHVQLLEGATTSLVKMRNTLARVAMQSGATHADKGIPACMCAQQVPANASHKHIL